MKRLSYYTTAILLVFAFACGSGETMDETEENMDEATGEVEDVLDEMGDEMDDVMEEADDEDDNEREISPEELPETVLNDINTRYPGAGIDEADEITNEDGSLSYDVEVETPEGDMELMYSASGEFMGMEADDGDNEEDEDEE